LYCLLGIAVLLRAKNHSSGRTTSKGADQSRSTAPRAASTTPTSNSTRTSCAARYTGYCQPEVDKLIDQQSAEPDREKRKQLVWEIERRLAEDGARPIIFYPRGGTCMQPYVKGLTTMVNSIYNGFRMEDVWLDK
jgi:ABC-type transport system substrate-binding protein